MAARSLCRPAVAGDLSNLTPETLLYVPPAGNFLVEAEHGPQGRFFYYAYIDTDLMNTEALAHHQTKRALIEPAHNCSTCSMILNSAHEFLHIFGTLERIRPDWFRENNHGLLEQQLRLVITRNPNGQDGFAVFTWSGDGRHVYPVAAIGFHIGLCSSVMLVVAMEPQESKELLEKFYQVILDNHDVQVRFKWRNANDIGKLKEPLVPD
jgi:hypothetical protein